MGSLLLFLRANLPIGVLFSLLGTPTSWAKEITLSLRTDHPGQKVALAADFLDWGERPLSMKESRPGVYTVHFKAPWLPKIQYKFIVDGHWIADPHNPDTLPDGRGGLNSVMQISSFQEDPLLSPTSETLPLVHSKFVLNDREGDPREVTLVTPLNSLPSVTIYFQDGGDYLERTGVQWLLAHLSNSAKEKGLPQFTGVFIPPKDRFREYQLLPVYADFVAEDLVRAVEARIPQTGGDRQRRLLVGPSLGGLITLYTALRHPEVFGFAASQSGSLWLNGGILLQDLGKPISGSHHQLKIFMDCGLYETEGMLHYNRLGFEVAQRAGHLVNYREYPSTHSWIGWRNRLQEILRYFFATSSSLR